MRPEFHRLTHAAELLAATGTGAERHTTAGWPGRNPRGLPGTGDEWRRSSDESPRTAGRDDASRRPVRGAAALLLATALALLAGNVFAATEVPFDWGPKPADMTSGDQFRLIFVSHGHKWGRSSAMSTYNGFVQEFAATSQSLVRDYASGFQMVGCHKDGTEARENTMTQHTASNPGVPIYWVNGARVADDYEDFYDGSWANEAEPRTERGGIKTNWATGGTGLSYTGCESNGRGLSDFELGQSSAAVGRLNQSGGGAGRQSHGTGRKCHAPDLRLVRSVPGGR